MLLFALCINPLLKTFEIDLTGIQVGQQQANTAVIAYADDVAIFLTDPGDIPKIQEALQTYEAATGAEINTTKSRALAFGAWDTNNRIMNMPYQ
jgi:hypothetical protein